MEYERKSSWENLDQSQVFAFCEKYKDFLTNNKNERHCIQTIIETLESHGFVNIEKVATAQKGDKVYKNIKGKTVLAFVVGEDINSWRIIGSHVDSPRLDLKPHPLYEEAGLAMMQTHYYGGIKKYQWVNVQLQLTGVIFTKDGKKIDISIGEKEDDPVFTIPDLLPHLAKDQMEKEATKLIEGEHLNIVVGNIPLEDSFKKYILKILNDTYGIVEEDFTVAELELAPSHKARDVGFDRSLIGAYAQDDKVSVYTSLMALVDTKDPKTTCVGMFVDKEEIGSMGDTGAQSMMLLLFAEQYKQLTGAIPSPFALLEKSEAISADVTAAMDPTHKSVHDKDNASLLGCGVSIEKYGGSRGKYNTLDAHSEYMQKLRSLCDQFGVSWQTGELGKIDIGGGGTIGMFMARYGMDCVDAGIPVLAMHSPFELSSKADVYSAYMLYKVFFQS